MKNQNTPLAWLAIAVIIFLLTIFIASFAPDPNSMDLRGLLMFLYLAPIGIAVFFLNSKQCLAVGIAVMLAGMYAMTAGRFTLKLLFSTAVIWELMSFAAFSYWLGMLSEKIQSQAHRYEESFSQMDELSFKFQQEQMRVMSLQKKYEDDTNYLNSLIITLSGLAKEIPSVLDVENLFKLLLDKTGKLFSATSCAIFSVDSNANKLSHVCSFGYDEGLLAGLKLTADEESGIPGWCAKNGKFLSAKDIEKDPYMADLVRQNKFPVAFCQPIVQRGKAIAVICVGATEKELPEKELINLSGILANISTIAIENARLMEKTKEQAIRDGLTGLYNHRYFYELLEGLMKKARHEGLILGVFLTDIDHFKKFNDTYGHQLGDMILQEAAKIVQDKINKVDIAARYGGEEFAVICVRRDEAEIKKLAEDIRKAVEEAVFQHASLRLSVTISLGVALYDLKASLAASELVNYSDQALYKAKEAGRNRVWFYGG